MALTPTLETYKLAPEEKGTEPAPGKKRARQPRREEIADALPLTASEYRTQLRGNIQRDVEARVFFDRVRQIADLSRDIKRGQAQESAHGELNRLYDDLASLRIGRKENARNLNLTNNLNNLRDLLETIRPTNGANEAHRMAAVNAAVENVNDALGPLLAQRGRADGRRAMRKEVVGAVPEVAKGAANTAVLGVGLTGGVMAGNAIAATLPSALLGSAAPWLPWVGGAAGALVARNLGEGKSFVTKAAALSALAYISPTARLAAGLSAVAGGIGTALTRADRQKEEEA